jgi:RNA polymerase sigma factor (sigma-70 family)
MQPTDDSVLLRQYAENHSDEAFAELVMRHLNLVYSVALRHIGNPHNAEEITQAVFVILAKKAAQLRHAKALSSWLFQVTRLTATNFVRSEMRRHRREEEAQMRSILNEPGSEVWPAIAPWLDEVVAGLREKDRQAIVLRFYEGRNLREVGLALGLSEDAAEKRVNRALEKLRNIFAKRGVSSTTAIIAGTISANSVQAAPVALAKSVTAVAIAKGAAGGMASLLASAKVGAAAKSAAAFGSLGGLFAMLGGAYISLRAQTDDTKSPRERQFMLQMIGIRIVAVLLFFAVCFGIGKLDFSNAPVTRDILKAAYIFSIYVLGMGLFSYSSRRQQIQIEERTFAEAEWTTPRKDTDSTTNSPDTNLKTIKSKALVLVISAVMIFQAPWKQHLGHAVLWSAVLVLCLFWSFHSWQNRPRYQSLRPGWVVVFPIMMGLMTLFFFNLHRYQAQAGSDASSVASPIVVIIFNLVVVFSYATFIAILAWKRKKCG